MAARVLLGLAAKFRPLLEGIAAGGILAFPSLAASSSSICKTSTKPQLLSRPHAFKDRRFGMMAAARVASLVVRVAIPLLLPWLRIDSLSSISAKISIIPQEVSRPCCRCGFGRMGATLLLLLNVDMLGSVLACTCSCEA